MMRAGRCNRGGSSAMAKKCQQALGDKNKVEMTASKIAAATGCDQTVAKYCVYIKHNQLDVLDLAEQLKRNVVNKNEEIKELKERLNNKKLQLDNANQKLAVLKTRGKPRLLPFTPVSSSCSSGMGDLNSAEPHERQESKPKRNRNRRVTTKQPISESSEPNVVKQQKTKGTESKVGKM